MLSLTTAQRDLLHLLLTAQSPVGAVTLGEQLHLTPRQVHYGLRGIKDWLHDHHANLRHTPGVGLQVECTPAQQRHMLAKLTSQSRFQLILTPEQRQQLVVLSLLVAQQPCTLNQLQLDLGVARATVLKDLDAVEVWLAAYHLQLMRRQHRGCWIDGDEFAKRQMQAALLWGDVPFDWPVMTVRPGQGFAFVLAHDAALLPVVNQVNLLVHNWDLTTAQKLVARAEEALGARFTDEAVLPLALAVALQNQRVYTGQHVAWQAETLDWLQAQVVWPVAARIAAQIWSGLPESVCVSEIAALALQLMCAARDEPWRNDVDADIPFLDLIDAFMARIAVTYAVSELAHDQLLRDGLDALLLPACMRQRFGVWSPPKHTADSQVERHPVERSAAAQLAAAVVAATGLTLPADALDDVVLLLHAAILRARPERARRVLVVCPSGIATTQLLIARLKARFPRLGTFEVLPMRELTSERITQADLIIATVPLALPDGPTIDVIQVHPMLKPEDIAALTDWMA